MTSTPTTTGLNHGCEQCGTVQPLTPSEYGDLCQRCAYRQAMYDDARDNFEHLAPSTFGFRYDDE